MNILLTSAGRRGYLVKYFKDVIGETGKVYVGNSSSLSPAFAYADCHVVTPLIYDANYIPFLKEYCLNNNITVIISLFDIDLYILACHKEEFKSMGIDIVVSDKEDELIARLDSKFHEMICEISGNKKLVSILGKIKELIFRYRLEYISDLKNKNIIIEEHKKIINDLKTKNEKAVRKDIEHHIEIQEKFILNSLEKEE